MADNLKCEKCGKGYSYQKSLDAHAETCKGAADDKEKAPKQRRKYRAAAKLGPVGLGADIDLGGEIEARAIQLRKQAAIFIDKATKLEAMAQEVRGL